MKLVLHIHTHDLSKTPGRALSVPPARNLKSGRCVFRIVPPSDQPAGELLLLFSYSLTQDDLAQISGSRGSDDEDIPYLSLCDTVRKSA